MNITPRRVLITGGAGFIGGHLAESFANEAEVRVLDDFSNGCRRVAEEMKQQRGVEMREGSILDNRTLTAAMRDVDVVFHLAAIVSVPECIRRPMHCHEVNATGTLRVLEAAALTGVQKVFLASSAAVYGSEPATVPTAESSPPKPETPYAIAKLMTEHYGRYFSRAGRVQTVALRFFNVYGARQCEHGAYAAVMARFISDAIAGRNIVINGDGEQTRDCIYVKDIVRAIRHVTLGSHITGVYNAGSGRAVGIMQLAERVCELMRTESQIVQCSGREGDIRHSCADIQALTATGWEVEWQLETGLVETIKYMQEQGIGRT